MKTTSLPRVFYPVIVTFVLWILWCFVMKTFPAVSGKDQLSRALMRIAVVLVPALVYLRARTSESMRVALSLTNHARGIVWGGLAAIIIALSSYQLLTNYQLPTGFSVWLNWIILSPLAEEVLFRAVLFRELKLNFGFWKAALLSSLLFVLIHLPPILILHTMGSTMDVLSYCGHVFVLSLLFTMAFHYSKSLWGSLLPHWTNNLISEGLV